MCKPSMSGLWCLLLVFLAGASVVHHTAKYSVSLAETYAQAEDVDPVTAVTLWQFGNGKGGQGGGGSNGHHRLTGLPGTMPLIPLGTASGGVATTYVYQAVSTTTVESTMNDGVLSVMGTRVSTSE